MVMNDYLCWGVWDKSCIDFIYMIIEYPNYPIISLLTQPRGNCVPVLQLSYHCYEEYWLCSVGECCLSKQPNNLTSYTTKGKFMSYHCYGEYCLCSVGECCSKLPNKPIISLLTQPRGNLWYYQCNGDYW